MAGSMAGGIEVGMPQVLDVSHIDHLFRVYGMVAQTASTFQKRTDFCVVAYHFAEKFWVMFYESAWVHERNNEYSSTEVEGTNSFEEWCAVQSYDQQKFAPPTSFSKWASWSPREDVVASSAAAEKFGRKQCGVNDGTLPAVSLSLGIPPPAWHTTALPPETHQRAPAWSTQRSRLGRTALPPLEHITALPPGTSQRSRLEHITALPP